VKVVYRFWDNDEGPTSMEVMNVGLSSESESLVRVPVECRRYLWRSVEAA
jgi:hypothetical protein